jgi:uncharacterized protein (TIGR02117 family)
MARCGNSRDFGTACIPTGVCAIYQLVLATLVHQARSRRTGVASACLLWLFVAATLASAHASEFYVVRHGWHSGIVVRRKDIPADTWPPGVAERDFAGCRCLELGWGDHAFYTAPHPGALMAVRAALVPGPSVLHVAGFSAADPAKTHQWAEVVRVSCTRAELTALCRALGTSFERDSANRAKGLGVGLYGVKSRFYAARGRYWIGNTCNSWTLREARVGGLPTRVGPAGTLSSGAVTAQVRRLLTARP